MNYYLQKTLQDVPPELPNMIKKHQLKELEAPVKKSLPPPAKPRKITPKRPAMDPLPAETSAKHLVLWRTLTPETYHFSLWNQTLTLKTHWKAWLCRTWCTSWTVIIPQPCLMTKSKYIHEIALSCTQSIKENTVQQVERQISVKHTSPS